MYDRDCGPVLCKLVSPRFVRFLRRTRIPLSVVAASLNVLDPLVEFAVTQTSTLLKTLGIKPYYFKVRLPAGYAMELKLGFLPDRHTSYTVDPKGGEHARPLCAPDLRVKPVGEDSAVDERIPGIFAIKVQKTRKKVA